MDRETTGLEAISDKGPVPKYQFVKKATMRLLLCSQNKQKSFRLSRPSVLELW